MGLFWKQFNVKYEFEFVSDTSRLEFYHLEIIEHFLFFPTQRRYLEIYRLGTGSFYLENYKMRDRYPSEHFPKQMLAYHRGERDKIPLGAKTFDAQNPNFYPVIDFLSRRFPTRFKNWNTFERKRKMEDKQNKY